MSMMPKSVSGFRITSCSRIKERMMPKSVSGFWITSCARIKERMMPKSVQRFSDHIIRKTKVYA